MKKTLFGFFAAAMLFGAQLMAQDAAPAKSDADAFIPSSANLTLEWKSRYMSKGKVCTPKQMLFGTFETYWDCGLYAGVWMANDRNSYNAADGVAYEAEEYDYYIGYAYTFKNDEKDILTLDLCYTYYDYPSCTGWQHEKSIQSSELALKATLKNIIMNPGAGIYWDPSNDMWYANLFASYTYNFKDVNESLDKLSWKNDFQLYWGNSKFNGYNKHITDAEGNRHHNDAHENGLYSFIYTTKLSYALTDRFSFGPLYQISWALNHNVREAWKDSSANNSCNMLWGVFMSLDF